MLELYNMTNPNDSNAATENTRTVTANFNLICLTLSPPGWVPLRRASDPVAERRRLRRLAALNRLCGLDASPNLDRLSWRDASAPVSRRLYHWSCTA